MREYRKTHYPVETMEVCQENLDMFFNFANERHLIWHRRFIEKLPQEQWTNDPILKNTKYTNDYRELDRGTLWYLEHVVKPYEEDQNFENLLWKTIMYRLCNRIETFEECGFPDYNVYDASKVENDYCAKLKVIADRGCPVMTSAHLTCPTPAGYMKYEGFVMAINSLYHNMKEGLAKQVKECKTLKEAFQTVCQVFCVGAFTGYEICCDLMYSRSIGVNGIPFTEDEWANVGPGATEGIRLLYPSSAVGLNKKSRIYERMVQLRDEQHKHFERLGIKFKFYERFTKGHLSLRSVEHLLCEFSKYWLQNKGLGKVRMKFEPDSHKSIIKEGDQIITKSN